MTKLFWNYETFPVNNGIESLRSLIDDITRKQNRMMSSNDLVNLKRSNSEIGNRITQTKAVKHEMSLKIYIRGG